ncbi:MAG: hypothetical protein V1793_16755 [Pseudomonadota bacterium]
MRCILYYRPENSSGKQLLALLKPLFKKHVLICHNSVPDLARELRQSANNEGIALLFIDSQEDLGDILAIMDLFWKHRIVLILPDMERETLARAVPLSPRYITSPEQGLSDIREVLIKLMDPGDRGV